MRQKTTDSLETYSKAFSRAVPLKSNTRLGGVGGKMATLPPPYETSTDSHSHIFPSDGRVAARAANFLADMNSCQRCRTRSTGFACHIRTTNKHDTSVSRAVQRHPPSTSRLSSGRLSGTGPPQYTIIDNVIPFWGTEENMTHQRVCVPHLFWTLSTLFGNEGTSAGITQ